SSSSLGASSPPRRTTDLKPTTMPSSAVRLREPGPAGNLTVRADPGVAVVVGLIRAYQAILSPLFRGACRFEPSCSHYGVEAVTTHGALRGSWLTARRIARC